jgi:hypothetical protein
MPVGNTSSQRISGGGQQQASRSSRSSCWRCSGSSNATGSTMRLSGPRVQSSRWQPYSQSRPSGDRAHIKAPSRSRSMSICSCQPLARSSRIRPHQISPQGLSARKASPARTASKACWISAAQQRLRGNRAGDASHCHGTRAPTPLGRSGSRNSGNGRDGGRGCGASPPDLAPAPRPSPQLAWRVKGDGWRSGARARGSGDRPGRRWCAPPPGAVRRSSPPACGPSPPPDPQLRCRPCPIRQSNQLSEPVPA